MDTSVLVAVGSGAALAYVAYRIYMGVPVLPNAGALLGNLTTTLIPDDYRNKIGRNNAAFKGDRHLTFRPQPLVDIDGKTKDFVTEYQVQGVYKDAPIADRDIAKSRPKGSWEDTIKTSSFLNSVNRSKYARWQ